MSPDWSHVAHRQESSNWLATYPGRALVGFPLNGSGSLESKGSKSHPRVEDPPAVASRYGVEQVFTIAAVSQ